MAPRFTQKQWALSHGVMLGILGLALFQFFRIVFQPLTVSFLDVGQGDAILIQTPEFKNILIDAGPDSKVIEEFSKRLGFFDKTIDLFILTNPDVDHYAGILDILEKYKLRRIMMTGVWADTKLYQTLIDELKKRQIEIVLPKSNQDLRIGQNIYLDIIYPFREESFFGKEIRERNNTSIVARLRRTTDRGWEDLVMLPGDAEEAEENEILVSGQNLRASILKLGHHGSRTSTSEHFLRTINPQMTIISAGRDNKYGHPHAEVVERVKNLKTQNTADEGTIMMKF